MKTLFTLLLSGMIAFTALTSTQANAHGRDSDAAAAAIIGGAVILGLGIAAARSERRWHRRHHHHHHYYYGGRPYYGFDPDYEPQYRLRDYRHHRHY